MGIPAAVPAPADPFASLYPSMTKPAATAPAPAQPGSTTAQPPQPATAGNAATGNQDATEEIDPETAAAAQALAKELNLPGDQAAKVLAHHKALTAKESARWTAEIQDWDRQLNADPEIGGANREASIGAARALLKEYAPPELMQDLAASGYGSHPGLVRFMVRVAKAMGTKAGQDRFKSIYTSMPNA